ncbi:single-stranded DNA-binding protein [Bacillus paralicheniformis]|nr:single-stranded DNA-binding protein [Bacillus paralicheniformis]
MMNRTVLVGRLTRDPELRYVGDGKPVVSFTLAVNRTFKNQNGETEADFINCVAWRNAENIAKFLKKGSMTDEEIAYDELDIAPWKLGEWKRRHGVKNGKISHGKKFTREEWEEKRKEGLTEPAIAEFFEYKTFSIYLRYKRSLGIPPMTKKIERTPELLAEIKKYLDQGLLIKEITEKISVKMSSAMVGRIIREEGLHDGKPDHKKRIRENRKTARKGA